MLVVIAAGGLVLVDNNKSLLEGFLHDLEQAAGLVDGRGADRSDSELSVYHDALVQRFEAVISSVHAVLGEALRARGCPVRIGSNFNWVVRRAADEGLIGPSDRKTGLLIDMSHHTSTIPTLLMPWCGSSTT